MLGEKIKANKVAIKKIELEKQRQANELAKENMDKKEGTKLKSLIEEDKYLIEAFIYESGETLRGNLISRIYQQENGKFCLLISAKSKTSDHKEDIIYRAENMNDNKHIEALTVIDKHIYTRYGLSYKLLTLSDKSWVKFTLGILTGVIFTKAFFINLY